MPEIFNGDSSWDQWIYHFEKVAVVNDWDEDARLRWLKVRLTGRAQSALQQYAYYAYLLYGKISLLLSGCCVMQLMVNTSSVKWSYDGPTLV